MSPTTGPHTLLSRFRLSDIHLPFVAVIAAVQVVVSNRKNPNITMWLSSLPWTPSGLICASAPPG